MRKSDLRDRMVLEVDSGERFMVVGDRAMAKDSYILLDDLDEDLSFTGADNEGIQKVYAVIQTFDQKDIDDLLELLWERAYTPNYGERYYIANIMNPEYFTITKWCNDSIDNMWLKRGLVFKIKKEAIECTKKMLDNTNNK